MHQAQQGPHRAPPQLLSSCSRHHSRYLVSRVLSWSACAEYLPQKETRSTRYLLLLDINVTLETLVRGLGLRMQKKASKQERLLVQSIAAAAATMEAPARPTSQEPGKAPGKPATQKPTVRLACTCYSQRSASTLPLPTSCYTMCCKATHPKYLAWCFWSLDCVVCTTRCRVYSTSPVLSCAQLEIYNLPSFQHSPALGWPKYHHGQRP